MTDFIIVGNAKAARDLGRHYIGSELNPDYIIMANERLGLL